MRDLGLNSGSALCLLTYCQVFHLSQSQCLFHLSNRVVSMIKQSAKCKKYLIQGSAHSEYWGNVVYFPLYFVLQSAPLWLLLNGPISVTGVCFWSGQSIFHIIKATLNLEKVLSHGVIQSFPVEWSGWFCQIFQSSTFYKPQAVKTEKARWGQAAGTLWGLFRTVLWATRLSFTTGINMAARLLCCYLE